MLASKLQFWGYRLKTIANSFRVLYSLPPEKLDAFLNSYEIYDHDWVDQKAMAATFGPDYEAVIKQKLIDWYSVLNHLCALGQVEKMYIPPAIDLSKNLIENQVLFERRMWSDLGLNEKSKVLDIGCGRGRIASHAASSTGAHVTGVNIDSDQLESAQKFTKSKGLSKATHFQHWDLNQIPFPFKDGAFDAIYEVQVFSLSKDLTKNFKEIHRLLKPGGRFACLEWVVLDAYDPKDPYHRRLMKLTKPVLGAIGNPTIQDYVQAMEKAGFKVLVNENASINGFQAPLIQKADKFFTRLSKLLTLLVKCKILPKHFNTLFKRLSEGGQDFVEADRLRLGTTSHYFVAQK